MNRETQVELAILHNDLRAISNRLARINDSLNGNLFTEMYAQFHYGPRVTSKAPEARREHLEAERGRLENRANEIKATMQAIMDAERHREQVLREVAEIVSYPIIGGAR